MCAIGLYVYTKNGVKPEFSSMTNYAFQGVGRMLKFITALAIHLIKCAAKANSLLVFVPQPKGVGLVILSNFAQFHV